MRKIPPIAVGAVLAAVAVLCLALSQCAVMPVAAEAAKAEVLVTVKAEGATGESTKAVVEVLGDDGKAAIPSTKVAANEEAPIGELARGSYSLRVVKAPVNPDGSTYELSESPLPFEVGADGQAVEVEAALEPIAAEDMTKEQLEAAADALEDDGKDGDAVKDKAQTAPSVPGSASSVTTEPSAPSTRPEEGGTTSKPSEPSQPSTPSHTHDWVAQTETVHHEAEYETVHHDAEYTTVHHEAVKSSVVVCLDCGAENPGIEHIKNHVMNGGNGGTTVVDKVIQEAWDEQVMVKDAWTEQVLVRDAYDEIVTTGYVCSCGATK